MGKEAKRHHITSRSSHLALQQCSRRREHGAHSGSEGKYSWSLSSRLSSTFSSSSPSLLLHPRCLTDDVSTAKDRASLRRHPRSCLRWHPPPHSPPPHLSLCLLRPWGTSPQKLRSDGDVDNIPHHPNRPAATHECRGVRRPTDSVSRFQLHHLPLH